MLDVFRSPTKNRPWTVSPRPADPLAWALRLEEEFAKDVGDWRFRPYLCLHEFEALLFASPDAIADVVSALDPFRGEMHSLLRAKGSPEHINDGPMTAPAKRLDAWVGAAYRKVRHGFLISEAIGVDAMRASRKHFDRWVTGLLAPTCTRRRH